MADRMASGRLVEIILTDQRAGYSAEEVARRLYADYGIELSGQTIRQWLAKGLDPDPEAVAQ